MGFFENFTKQDFINGGLGLFTAILALLTFLDHGAIQKLSQIADTQTELLKKAKITYENLQAQLTILQETYISNQKISYDEANVIRENLMYSPPNLSALPRKDQLLYVNRILPIIERAIKNPVIQRFEIFDRRLQTLRVDSHNMIQFFNTEPNEFDTIFKSYPNNIYYLWKDLMDSLIVYGKILKPKY